MMKPRVLVIAEAANPEWVSVPLVGWSLALALREVAQVHLVTQIRNREAILRTGLAEGTDFTAIDSEAIAKPVWALGKMLRMGDGKGWTMLQAVNALSYPTFERKIWAQFGDRLRAREFDIVHRVTPLSPTITSKLATRCAEIGVPFVMGPLNGGVPWPTAFASARRQEREWLSYLRGVYKVLPGRGRMLSNAAAILVGSRHTQSEIPARFQAKTIYLPENAIDLSRFNRIARQGAGPLRACFIGRMVPYKGPDMLLEAAAPLLRDGTLLIDMIGDGPMLPALKKQVEVDGTQAAVTFHGWLAHAEVQNIAARSSVFAFPSIREFGGGVVLEAMALGLVPLIVDYAGPGELVTGDVGRKVPLGDRATIVAGFRAELAQLAADPARLGPLADAARARVQAAFTWSRKAAQIAQVYDWVLQHRVEKPDFSADLAGKSPQKDQPDV
jgi:glycogen synthase